jgi:hypothetical protein
MPYKTRNWEAVESTDLVGSKYVLTVTGEVEVHKSNEVPRLAEQQPPGINPISLILDLSIQDASQAGGEVVLWKPVEYDREVSPGQFKDVLITGVVDPTTVAVETVPA